MCISGYSYLVDLVGSRQSQVFMREGGKEYVTLSWTMFMMVVCVANPLGVLTISTW